MAKKVHPNVLLGQRGVNLIEKVVLEMECLWYPSGQVEAGIDGVIEIRDAKTGEATNCIVQVQSKTTDRQWDAETHDSFAFHCQERDLDYWMSGNAPVVLVCSRPRTGEAYWIAVKSYFKDPARRKSRTVVFDRTRDVFDASARQRLVQLAVPRSSGLYCSPPPKQEHLVTNLLRVTKLPETLHHAEATIRTEGEIRHILQEQQVRGQWEWLLRSKCLLSLFPLDGPPWNDICDLGTYETFDASDWSASDDAARRREFVQLLNISLSRKVASEIAYSRRFDVYYFRATKDLQPKRLRYRTRLRQTSREVFRGYSSPKDPTRMSYYRHAGFEGHFVRSEGVWFLEIVPTYYFTFDGERRSRIAGSLLAGIKRFEHNDHVRNQLMMWAAYLSRPSTLYDKEYPYLNFGRLEGFDVPSGIDDAAWLPPDVEEQNDEGETGDGDDWVDGELFG